jgi:hypothetical protein
VSALPSPSDQFDPDTILALSKAYESALAALDAVAPETARSAAAARHGLARQIVQMARHGERDPDRLRLGVLTELRRA